MWADALLELAAALPDAELTEEAEAGAAAAASALYERSVAAYGAASPAPPAPPRADAAVNAANALCAAAELAPAVAAGRRGAMLARAVELYRAALSVEEDALVRGVYCVRGCAVQCVGMRPPNRTRHQGC